MPAIQPKTAAVTQPLPPKDLAGVQIQNILFATDFSDSSKLAVPFAVGMAECFGAKLYTVHVQEPINYALPPDSWMPAEASCHAELQAVARDIEQLYPYIPQQTIRAEGPVSQAIEAEVRKHHIDIVVIGTHGRSGVGRLLLGSQAEAIIREATCPVLTVGPCVTSPARQKGQVRSILLATDFGPSSEPAAKYAIAMANEFKAKVALLHVMGKREAHNLWIPGDGLEGCVQRLEALRPSDAEAWSRSMVMVEHGPIAEKILEVARERDTDLIVLGIHERHGVPGAATHVSHATVHEVIAHAECPVLTVPAPREK